MFVCMCVGGYYLRSGFRRSLFKDIFFWLIWNGNQMEWRLISRSVESGSVDAEILC